MSKCCAYHWSRSPAGIFFGYQRSTKPGSDQLAVPTRIFPVSVLPEDLLVTHQRSHTPRRRQVRLLSSLLASIGRMLFRFAQRRYRNYSQNAGWSSLVARQAHNLKAAGSNPAPATKFFVANDPALAAAVLGGHFCVRKRLPPRIARDNIHAPQLRRKKIQRSSVVESRRSRD